MQSEKNTGAENSSSDENAQTTPQEDGNSDKLGKAKRTRGAKTPRDPDVYFLNTEQVGRILGVRENDARFLMESGAIHSYMHRSMLKTTRTDVDTFVDGLREGSLDIPGLLIVHDNTRARMNAREAATEKLRQIEEERIKEQNIQEEERKVERLKRIEELKKMEECKQLEKEKRMEEQRIMEAQRRLDELKLLQQQNAIPNLTVFYILCQPTTDPQFIDAQIQSQQNPNS